MEFAMRVLACLTALLASMVLSTSTTVRADDEPDGMIGIQLKVGDGKLTIVGAFKGGPADKAGIKADDVLLKINDYKVKENAEQDDLQEAVKEVGKFKPNDKVKITVKRGDKDVVIEVTVGKRSEILKDLEKQKEKEKSKKDD
jgi:C-terminal processing protease CtpA/Prc